VWYGWPIGGPFPQSKVSTRPLNLTRAEVVCDNGMHAAVLRPFFLIPKIMLTSMNTCTQTEYLYQIKSLKLDGQFLTN
jgi:hypothetical protein